jgi:hypothetical protein
MSSIDYAATVLVCAAGAVFAAVLVVVFCIELVERFRRRRSQRHAAAVVRRRLDDVAALPAPDELPHSPDLTPGQRRQLRQRVHPVPHKRRSRPWGA